MSVGLVNGMENTILNTLKKSDVSLTINEIAEMINAHRTTTSKYLAIMEARGLINCRNVGKAKLYYVINGDKKRNGVIV